MPTITKTTPPQSVQIIAPRHILKGNLYSIPITSMRTAIEGMLQICMSPGCSSANSTAFTVAPRWIVRRILTNSGIVPNYSIPYSQDTLRTTVKSVLLNNAPGPYPSGTRSFAWDGAQGAATITVEDTAVFWGTQTIPTGLGDVMTYTAGSGCEAMRINSSAPTTTPLVVDAGSKYVHGDNEVVNLGNVWEVPLEGGYDYELIIDHSMDTASTPAILVFADLQKVDSYTST